MVTNKLTNKLAAGFLGYLAFSAKTGKVQVDHPNNQLTN